MRSKLASCCGMFAAMLVVISSSAGTKTWDGGAMTSNWADGNNWNPDGVPGPSDHVVIDVDGALTVNYSTLTTTIASLSVVDGLAIVSGSLTISGTSSIAGTLTFTNGTLALGDAMSVDGTLGWAAGTLMGPGSLTVGATGVASFTSGSRILATTFVNQGDAAWTAGSFSLSDGTFENAGMLVANSSGTLTASGGAPVGAVNLFGNAGTFRKEGTGICQFITSGSALPIQTTGTVELVAGTLRFASGGTIDGLVDADAGTTFELQGPFTFGGGADIATDGTLFLNSAIGTYPMDIAVGGELRLLGGSSTFSGAVSAAMLSLEGGIHTFDGAVSSPDIELTGGTLQGSADLVVTGVAEWSASTVTGTGGFTVQRGATMTMFSSTHTLGRDLVNEGEIMWTGGSFTFEDATFLNLGTFTADSGGALTAFGGAPGTNVNLFDNQGTFRKMGAGTCQFFTSSSALPVHHAGVIEASAGTLRFTSGGAIEAPIDATGLQQIEFQGAFTFTAGATIAGSPVIFFSSVTGTYPAPIASTNQLRLSGGAMTFTAAVDCGTFSLESGTHTFDATVTSPDIELTNGTFQGSADLVVTNSADWSGATVSGTGGFTVQRGATMTMFSSTHGLSRDLVNEGEIMWTGGSFTFEDATFLNLGTFTADSGGALTAFGGAPGTNVNLFDNQGTFRKMGAGTCQFFTSSSALPVHHAGVIEASAGTLRFASGGAIEAPIDATGLQQIEFQGAFTFTAGATIAGSPIIFFSSMTGTYPAPIASTNQLRLSGGAMTFTAAVDCGMFSLESGTHTFDATVTSPDIELTNGTFQGSADLVVTGIAQWNAATVGGTGDFTVLPGATMTMFSSTHGLSRDLVNEGEITWTGGSISFDDATILNLGTFTADSGGTLSAFGGAPGTNVNLFDNQGTFRKMGAGTCQFFTSSSALPVHHAGVIEASAGTLRFASGGAIEAPIDATGLQQIEFQGAFTFTAGATIAGSPTIFFNSSTATCPAPISSTSQLRLAGGAMTFTAAVDCGTLSLESGTHTFDATVTSPDIELTNGTFQGSADLVVTGMAQWNAATVAGTGGFTVLPGATMTVFSSTHGLSRDLVNEGEITWTGGSISFNDATLLNLGTFTADSGGTLSAFGGAPGTNVNLFDNQGMFLKMGAGLCQMFTSSSGLPFTNAGIVEVLEGSLRLSTGLTNFVGGTLTGGTFHVVSTLEFFNADVVTLAGQLILDGPAAAVRNTTGNDALDVLATIGAAGELELRNGRTQTIVAGLVNNGVVTIDKTSELDVTGAYAQGSGGTFSIAFGSDGMGGVALGRALVGGAASLAGLVQAVQVDAYVPANCDQFAILIAGSLTGAFTSTDLPPLTSFPVWTIDYSATTATLLFADVDLNDDNVVNGADLGILLGSWGESGVPADLNCNGIVDGADLGVMLGAWGAPA